MTTNLKQQTKAGLLAGVAILALGAMAAPAQAVEYRTLTTMAPKLSGSDPQGFEGHQGTFTITIPGTVRPASHTTTTATYNVDAGAMKLQANATTGAHLYKSTGKAKLTYSIPATGPDTITVQGPFTYKGSGFTLTCVFSLPPGSLTSAALKHPMKFSPSPANVTSPKSYMSYTLNGTTKLGLAGTVSSK